MPTDFAEPGQMVLSVLDELIEKAVVRPVRTNGKPLALGPVYSQLVLGMPCDPRDYMAPWSPAGGGTIEDVRKNKPEIAVPAGEPGAQPATAPGIDPELQRGINAAWKTSRLVDAMLMVTNDNSYAEYPVGRTVSGAYDNIIAAMQPKPGPAVPPNVQAQIDSAKKVLYQIDPADGSIVGQTKLYEKYLANAAAYAQAKADFTIAQNKALSDPATARSWPLLSAPFKQKVDIAFDALKAGGAEKVEGALDVLGSVGVSLPAHMVHRAKDTFEQWTLSGLSGVADKTPYAYISPTSWADPAEGASGWQHLTVSHSEYKNHSEFHSSKFVSTHYTRDTSSSSGGGGAAFFGFGGYGSGGTSSLKVRDTFQSQSGDSYRFHNDSKNLTIELQYALCTINRPWLMGDIFYLRDWYMNGTKKNAISDGTVSGMVGDFAHLMPMIPTHFLAIRNVKITASKQDWGGDGETLSKMYQDSQTQGSNWSAGGSGGFSCGLLTIGGHGSHSKAHTDSTFNSRSSTDTSNNFGWSFDGETLEIMGTQIVAWLSAIVPATPPLDAPGA
jgi:hypothetical protein